MPMERSVSCAAERTTGYGGAADLRSYSASYVPRAPSKVKHSRSTASSWSRPGAVQRSGSVKSVAAGPTPGLNLRCYSASYAASYGPTAAPADAGATGSTAAAAAGGGQLKRSGSVTNWSSSAGRRSVNLRGYTPSFSALESTAAAVAPAPPARKQAAASGGVLDEAELQRKKRLVAYKAYDVEGKVRDSVRRGVSWIKSRCARVAYSWW